MIQPSLKPMPKEVVDRGNLRYGDACLTFEYPPYRGMPQVASSKEMKTLNGCSK